MVAQMEPMIAHDNDDGVVRQALLRQGLEDPPTLSSTKLTQA